MTSGVIKSEIFWDKAEERLHHKTSQPSEKIILERNKNLRKDGDVLKDLSFGRQIANIPFITYEWAIRHGFDLNCPDAQIAQKELFRFLTTTDEGRACLVRDHI